MPPRYAYWTILVDDQPTAFRAGAKEDLLPTFNRLKEKHASATMMWFQNGKLWPSRLDAQEAMRARGEMGRRACQARWRLSGSCQARRPAGPPTHEVLSALNGRRPQARTPARPHARKPARPRIRQARLRNQGRVHHAPKRSERPERPERSSGSRRSSFARDSKPDWKPEGLFRS